MSDWKFADAPNTAVVVLDEVLRRATPLREVVHDVQGDWQFLDGEPIAGRAAKLVGLEEMIALDPSLAELADLRLGWRAARDSEGDAWSRESTYPLEWEALVAAATEHTTLCQERLSSEFKMGSWERFDVDQQAATFTWSSGGAVRVRADLRIAGTLSHTSGTWLWSWDNSQIVEDARADVAWLADFGEENGFSRLAEAKWSAEEVDAWEVTSVACLLFQAEGLYRAPGKVADAFLLLDNVRWEV